MISVFFVEILPKAREALIVPLGLHAGSWMANDRTQQLAYQKLLRTGMFTALLG